MSPTTAEPKKDAFCRCLKGCVLSRGTRSQERGKRKTWGSSRRHSSCAKRKSKRGGFRIGGKKSKEKRGKDGKKGIGRRTTKRVLREYTQVLREEPPPEVSSNRKKKAAEKEKRDKNRWGKGKRVIASFWRRVTGGGSYLCRAGDFSDREKRL